MAGAVSTGWRIVSTEAKWALVDLLSACTQ